MGNALQTNRLFDKWRSLVFVLLIVAGLVGNYFSYPIFLNIDFLFGGVFAMLALQFFGLGLGVLAAALIASYTFVLWNEPYAFIIMTAEVAVVGLLIDRRKLGMVMADAIYWLVLGLPLAFLFYHLVLKVPASSTWIIGAKQTINGLATALLARLVYSGLGVHFQLWKRSFQEVFCNLLVMFVMLPSLIILGIISRLDFEYADSDLHSELIEHSNNTKALFQRWVKDRNQAVVELASLAATADSTQMNDRLEQARRTDPNILRIGRRDRNSVVIAYSPLIDQSGQSNIGKQFPERPYISTIRRTGQSMLAEVVMGRIDAPQPVVILLAPVVKQGEFDGYVNAVLSLTQIRDILSRAIQDRNSLYTLIDQNGNVVMSNRPEQTTMKPFRRNTVGVLKHIGDGVSQWIPEVPANTSVSERWRQSFYVFEAPVGLHDEWKVIFEDPVAPVQERLYTRYATLLTLLLFVVLVALALAHYLSRKSVSTLRALSVATHELPSKLGNAEEAVNWPETAMEETTELISNFKVMAGSLLAMLTRLKQTNESLEQKVADRTRELHTSEQRFRKLIEWSPEAMAVHRDGKFIFVNPAAVKLLGANSDNELIGTAIIDRVHPDYRAVVIERVRRSAEGGVAPPLLQEKLIRIDGAVIDVEVIATSVDFDGEPATQVAMHDVTESKRIHAQLETLLREQHAVLHNELVGIVRVIDRNIVWANPAFEQMLGYDTGQATGTATRQNYINEDAYLRFGESAYPLLAAGSIFRTRIEHVRRNGERIWVDISGAILNEATGESLWTFSDITERKKVEDQIHEFAFHDGLTGLPNRRLLMDRLSQTMIVSKRSGRHAAILFLDLDNFKPLNDEHGHDVGDLLLMEVASRLKRCVRDRDTVSRFGGDEFVVLLSELAADKVESASQVQLVAEKIRFKLAESYLLDVRGREGADRTVEHRCTVSIGVVVFNHQNQSLDGILQSADAAMYQAKAHGRNTIRFCGESGLDCVEVIGDSSKQPLGKTR